MIIVIIIVIITVIVIVILFRTLRATAAPSTYGPGNWGETPMADHPLIQTLGKTWTRIRTQSDIENR